MEYTRTIERTFAASDDLKLVVANRQGKVEVRGEDRADVAFTATLRARAESEEHAEELFDALDLPMSQDRGKIEIGPPEFFDDEFDDMGLIESWLRGRRDRVRIDMVALVPVACVVDASNRSGSVEVTSTNGRVEATTRAGGVSVTEVDGDVRAETRSGTLNLRSVRGSVEGETRDGSITAERITGPLELSSRSGAVRLDTIEGPVQVHGRSGSVRYRGPIAHAVEVTLRTGAIQLSVTPDSSFFLDAESGRGSVWSEFDVDAARDASADVPTVRLRTSRGSINVAPTREAATAFV